MFVEKNDTRQTKKKYKSYSVKIFMTICLNCRGHLDIFAQITAKSSRKSVRLGGLTKNGLTSKIAYKCKEKRIIFIPPLLNPPNSIPNKNKKQVAILNSSCRHSKAVNQNKRRCFSLFHSFITDPLLRKEEKKLSQARPIIRQREGGRKKIVHGMSRRKLNEL